MCQLADHTRSLFWRELARPTNDMIRWRDASRDPFVIANYRGEFSRLDRQLLTHITPLPSRLTITPWKTKTRFCFRKKFHLKECRNMMLTHFTQPILTVISFSFEPRHLFWAKSLTATLPQRFRRTISAF
jgi:hypothetical protein